MARSHGATIFVRLRRLNKIRKKTSTPLRGGRLPELGLCGLEGGLSGSFHRLEPGGTEADLLAHHDRLVRFLTLGFVSWGIACS